MSEEEKGLKTNAYVAQVRTATGGGFRVGLDLPEVEIVNAMALLGLYQKNVEVTIKVIG